MAYFMSDIVLPLSVLLGSWMTRMAMTMGNTLTQSASAVPCPCFHPGMRISRRFAYLLLILYSIFVHIFHVYILSTQLYGCYFLNEA